MGSTEFAAQNFNFSTTTSLTDLVNLKSNFSDGLIPSIEEIEFDRFLKKKILVTVYLAILCVVGTIGNAHAFLVYNIRYKPSNHRTFLVWLAAVDLIACSLSIPFEIVDTRYTYTFYSAWTCKLFRSLNHFVASCSGFLLGVIAVERYMKACRPLGRQLSEKQAKIACVITVIFCIALSVPSTFLYGLSLKRVEEYPSLIGSDCTVLAKFKGTTTLRVYSFILFLLCTVVFIVCVVTYTFIGRVLYRQLQFRRSSQTLPSKRRLSSFSSCKEVRCSSSDGGGNVPKRDSNPKIQHEDESSVAANGNGHVNSLPSSPTSAASFRIKFGKVFKRKRIFDRSKQITLMFLVATAVSYAGYLPHLVLIIIQGVSKGTYAKISATLGPLAAILIRGYFLSNATNPLVYCFMDDRFRKECKNLYRKLKEYILPRRSAYEY